VAERERAVTLERLAAGRADFFGDSYEMSEADRAQMEKHISLAADQLMNCLAHGVDGWVDDMLAFVKPWGFEVGAIRVPTLLKYGRTDNLVPSAHGDWLAAHIPNVQTWVHEEAGHAGDDADVERVHAWIAGEVDDPSAST
jgi:pimeloyl-ACP methyl ester carboxylesterase